MEVTVESPAGGRTSLPAWIRTRPPTGPSFLQLKNDVRDLGLSTVCREARCPNVGECWSAGAATVMLLGDRCSRRCGFCAVQTHWGAGQTDPTEPERVAEAVRRWQLRYVVLTQVCRDDLPDGGAALLRATVDAIRRASPATLVELLVGDLAGDERALRALLLRPPDVLAHNLETVRRLTPSVRDRRATYARSLEFLARARSVGPPGLVTKSSIMLGLGEREAELVDAFRDLRAVSVDLLTLGQYLRPTSGHLCVERFVPPEEFDALAEVARTTGFAGVEAGPMVRSSYRAESLYRAAVLQRGRTVG